MSDEHHGDVEKSTDHSEGLVVLKLTTWARGGLARFRGPVFIQGVLVEGEFGAQYPGTLSTREYPATRDSLVIGSPVLQSRSSGELKGNLGREY